MATNYIQPGESLRVGTANGAESGDPMVVGGYLPCVLLTDAESDSPYEATVATQGIFDLSVEAVDDDGNSAVSVGDAIYYTSGDDPVLNKKSSGEFFGVALEDITSGSTDTINILLRPKAGVGGVGEDSLSASVQDRIAQLSVSAADNADGTGTLTVQAQDAGGNDLADNVLTRIWVGTADDLGKDAINSMTIATGTEKEEVTANAEYLAITTDAGLAEVTLDLTADGSVYAWCELGGRIYSSGEIAISGN